MGKLPPQMTVLEDELKFVITDQGQWHHSCHSNEMIPILFYYYLTRIRIYRHTGILFYFQSLSWKPFPLIAFPVFVRFELGIQYKTGQS